MAWNQSNIIGPVHLPKTRDSAGNVIEWNPGYHLILGDPALLTVGIADKQKAYTDLPVRFAGLEPIVVTFTDEAEAIASELGSQWSEFEQPDDFELPVPRYVTPRQLRLALHADGLTPAMNLVVDALDEVQRIEWEYATQIDRQNEYIVQAAYAMGLDDEHIDIIFRAAVVL